MSMGQHLFPKNTQPPPLIRTPAWPKEQTSIKERTEKRKCTSCLDFEKVLTSKIKWKGSFRTAQWRMQTGVYSKEKKEMDKNSLLRHAALMQHWQFAWQFFEIWADLLASSDNFYVRACYLVICYFIGREIFQRFIRHFPSTCGVQIPKSELDEVLFPIYV